MNGLYRAFVQVVRSDTVLAAAEVLHMTQPTLSRQIQQLEQMLGIHLFDRVGKRLLLNRAGELVYEYASGLIALEEKMYDALSSFSNPETGTVTIGAGLTPSIYLLPPVIAAYRQQHPGVSFRVHSKSSKETCAALERREIDMGVVTTVDDAYTSLIATPLMRDDLLVVASPQHALCHYPRLSSGWTWRECADYPFVLMHVQSGLRSIVDKVANRMETPLSIAAETDSLESMNRLIQEQIGIGVLPTSAVREDVAAGRLCVIPITDTRLGSRTITLLERPGGVTANCALQFRRYIQSVFAAESRVEGDGNDV